MPNLQLHVLMYGFLSGTAGWPVHGAVIILCVLFVTGCSYFEQQEFYGITLFKIGECSV